MTNLYRIKAFSMMAWWIACSIFVWPLAAVSLAVTLLPLGFVLTIFIHSSSSGVALLQVVVSTKKLSVISAIYMILGQNIGTCIDALIGSITTNKAGKQTAFIHILYNIIGVLIFYPFTQFLYFIVSELSPHNLSRQIAHAHSIFNVTTTIILLPLSNYLVKLSKLVMHIKKNQ